MTSARATTAVHRGDAAAGSQIEVSYRMAERVTATWAKSFYFASRFLPPAKRRAVFALYDYCRHADNLVDERGTRSAADARGDLARLDSTIRSLHAGRYPADPRWLALWDTLNRFEVPLAPLVDLLEGVATDLEPVEFQTFDDLQEYCRLVAGGVGLMLGPVLGAGSSGFREYGVKLGIAMQLTNVLRDIAEDLEAGRIYLPLEELQSFGLSRAILLERRVTPSFRTFMQFQIERARVYFAAGDAVVGLFPADGSRLTVRLLQRTYRGILDEIERQDYDVFRTRAYVPLRRKVSIMLKALVTN